LDFKELEEEAASIVVAADFLFKIGGKKTPGVSK
jgi:hypothetical protein